MPINRATLIRISTIDKCLQNHYRRWTINDLIDACTDALAEFEGRSNPVSRRTFQNDLALRGWRVEAVYLGNPMRHDEKYLLINQGFAGKQRLVPFFNRSNNEDLILAIQSAGVSRGRNGFRKDKSGEKLAESEEDLLEHRTDGSDAFDTLYIGCEKFPYHDSFSLSMSGVI